MARQRSASRPRVLIVEDEALQAYSMARLVEGEGFEVVGPAHDEHLALQLIGSDPPDIAVVDIDLSGPRRPREAAARCTSAQVVSALTDWGVPYVLVTAHDGVSFLAPDASRAPRLSKPYRAEDLRMILRDALTMDVPA